MAKSKSTVIVNNNLLKSAPPDPLGYTEDLTPSNRLEWFIYHAGEGNGGGGGSSDFTTAKLTVIGGALLFGPFYGKNGPENMTYYTVEYIGAGTHTVDVVLYDGAALIDTGDVPSDVSGDIENISDTYYKVTGDAQITFSTSPI